MNRRNFIKGLGLLGGCALLPGCVQWRQVGRPTASGAIPSYWCTWCREVAHAENRGRRTELLFPGDQGTIGARDTIDERSLFGAGGWARYFPNERGDLLLVIDDGWDVPYGLDPWGKGDMPVFGSLEPHPNRFPSFGKTWRQDAPAVMSSGLRLPKVETLFGETPFVIAGRNPNGSLAVAALPRCVNGKFAAGEVAIEIDDVLRPGQKLAVFAHRVSCASASGRAALISALRISRQASPWSVRRGSGRLAGADVERCGQERPRVA